MKTGPTKCLTCKKYSNTILVLGVLGVLNNFLKK